MQGAPWARPGSENETMAYSDGREVDSALSPEVMLGGSVSEGARIAAAGPTT